VNDVESKSCTPGSACVYAQAKEKRGIGGWVGVVTQKGTQAVQVFATNMHRSSPSSSKISCQEPSDKGVHVC
jgi:hypothetical protein